LETRSQNFLSAPSFTPLRKLPPPLRIPALGGLLVSELWQRRETGRASI
jgi:hypothetical protein